MLKKTCLTCDASWEHGAPEVHRLDCRYHSRKALPQDKWSLTAARKRAAATEVELQNLGQAFVGPALPFEWALVVIDRAHLLALVDALLAACGDPGNSLTIQTRVGKVLLDFGEGDGR